MSDGNDQIFIYDNNSVDAGAGNDTVTLRWISDGLPAAAIEGGSGHDVLDASNVFVGSGYMLFADLSFGIPGSPEGIFKVGDFLLSNFEEVIGNRSQSNYFLLQHQTAPMTIYGGNADDTIIGGFDGDTLYGRGGNDAITVRPNGHAFGGDGNDTFDVRFPSTYNNSGSISGGRGHDTLSLSFGFSVNMQLGEAVSPMPGSDIYAFSSIEAVTVYAYSGYETTVIGNSVGNVLQVNSNFNDGTVGVKFFGRGGSDTLLGSSGNDILKGGSGADLLVGGTGHDVMSGGSGHDVMSGGSGHDRFVFGTADAAGSGMSRDEITDFKTGMDQIDLGAFLGGGSYIGVAIFSKTAGEIRLNLTAHILQGDVNGDGMADFEISLFGVTVLSISDFSF